MRTAEVHSIFIDNTVKHPYKARVEGQCWDDVFYDVDISKETYKALKALGPGVEKQADFKLSSLLRGCETELGRVNEELQKEKRKLPVVSCEIVRTIIGDNGQFFVVIKSPFDSTISYQIPVSWTQQDKIMSQIDAKKNRTDIAFAQIITAAEKRRKERERIDTLQYVGPDASQRKEIPIAIPFGSQSLASDDKPKLERTWSIEDIMKRLDQLETNVNKHLSVISINQMADRHPAKFGETEKKTQGPLDTWVEVFKKDHSRLADQVADISKRLAHVERHYITDGREDKPRLFVEEKDMSFVKIINSVEELNNWEMFKAFLKQIRNDHVRITCLTSLNHKNNSDFYANVVLMENPTIPNPSFIQFFTCQHRELILGLDNGHSYSTDIEETFFITQ